VITERLNPMLSIRQHIEELQCVGTGARRIADDYASQMLTAGIEVNRLVSASKACILDDERHCPYLECAGPRAVW
jgi:hypothetical protein